MARDPVTWSEVIEPADFPPDTVFPSAALDNAAKGPLLDDDGWPILENASMADLILAFKAAANLSTYGNFVRAALAGIYAERERSRDA